jgi:N-acetyl-gamma-glutamyl-phosphate reductase
VFGIFAHYYCVSSLFKELSKDQKEALKSSKRISNPGCYPTGFISLTRPLVDAGILPEGTPVTVNAISGYSGGGKGLMEIFEAGKAEPWGSYGFNLVRTIPTCLIVVVVRAD